MTKSFNERREKMARFICGCRDKSIPDVHQTKFIEGFKSGSSWTLAYLVNHPDELNELVEETKHISNSIYKEI